MQLAEPLAASPLSLASLSHTAYEVANQSRTYSSITVLPLILSHPLWPHNHTYTHSMNALLYHILPSKLLPTPNSHITITTPRHNLTRKLLQIQHYKSKTVSGASQTINSRPASPTIPEAVNYLRPLFVRQGCRARRSSLPLYSFLPARLHFEKQLSYADLWRTQHAHHEL